MEQSYIIEKVIKEKIIPQLEKSFNENIASVILYGSVARGNPDSNSDINLLILLKKNSPESVMKFGKSAAGLIRKNKITPLIMTAGEFSSSADVFPMEYNDIRDSYILIKGEDPVPALSLTDRNLRHQTEFALRGIINQIRQFITASGGSRRYLSLALKKISGSIESVMRGALRLKKQDVKGLSRREIIEKTAELYSLDPVSGFKLADTEKSSAETDISDILSFLVSLTEKIDEMDF